MRFIVCFFFFHGLMGSPKAITHPNGSKLKTSASAILILIISLTLFPSNAASEKDSSNNGVIVKQKKLVLGSRPPGCFNKCLGCKPCKAALIISVHHRDGGGHTHMAMMASSSSSVVHLRDDGYYLVSWKCKCGNKLFQP